MFFSHDHELLKKGELDMDNLRSRGLFGGAGLSLVSLRLTRMKEADRELTGVVGS
jgi:hypothetical protein